MVYTMEHGQCYAWVPHKLFTLKNNVCFRYKVYVVCFIVTYVNELIEVIIVGFENNYMYLDNFRPPTYLRRPIFL